MTRKPLWPQRYENTRRKGGLRKLKQNTGFGRIPFSVLSDKRLAPIEIKVYGVMSWAERNGNAYIGERLIGEICKVGRQTVRDASDHLAGCGHVRVSHGRQGQRNCYILTDPIFAEKREKEGHESKELYCTCCQKQIYNVLCDDCHGARRLADAI